MVAMLECSYVTDILHKKDVLVMCGHFCLTVHDIFTSGAFQTSGIGPVLPRIIAVGPPACMGLGLAYPNPQICWVERRAQRQQTK